MELYSFSKEQIKTLLSRKKAGLTDKELKELAKDPTINAITLYLKKEPNPEQQQEYGTDPYINVVKTEYLPANIFYTIEGVEDKIIKGRGVKEMVRTLRAYQIRTLLIKGPSPIIRLYPYTGKIAISESSKR